MRSGGRDVQAVLAALEKTSVAARRAGEAHRMKFMPELRFRIDTTFDEADRIDRLLRSPEVAARPQIETRGPAMNGRAPERRNVHGLARPRQGCRPDLTAAVAALKRSSGEKKSVTPGTLIRSRPACLPIALGRRQKRCRS